MLSMSHLCLAVEKLRARRQTFGSRTGCNGPKKATAGCVSLRAAQRNSIGQAVTDETASATMEIVIKVGSAMLFRVLQKPP